MKGTFFKFVFIFFSPFIFYSAASAQQSDLDAGIGFYNQSNFADAVKVLKKSVKTNPQEAKGWYYLGISYLKTDAEKDAAKALEKAVALAPEDVAARSGLAYAYLIKNDTNAALREAQEVLKVSPKNYESHYIIGVVAFRNGSYQAAYERANKIIELNPNLPSAYLLKSESLIASFLKQIGTVMKPTNARSETLNDAAAELEKFIKLSAPKTESKFHQEYLDSVRFFADYYRRKEQTGNYEFEAKPDKRETNFRITYKPRANYTDRARNAGVGGIVRLLVGFSADGKIRHVLIVNPLGYGLNEESVKAARKIRFDPAMLDGKPISLVKEVQYSFTIY